MRSATLISSLISLFHLKSTSALPFPVPCANCAEYGFGPKYITIHRPYIALGRQNVGRADLKTWYPCAYPHGSRTYLPDQYLVDASKDDVNRHVDEHGWANLFFKHDKCNPLHENTPQIPSYSSQFPDGIEAVEAAEMRPKLTKRYVDANGVEWSDWESDAEDEEEEEEAEWTLYREDEWHARGPMENEECCWLGYGQTWQKTGWLKCRLLAGGNGQPGTKMCPMSAFI